MKKTFELTDDERKRVFFAVHAAANVIETGDPAVSAQDAENMRDLEHERRYGRRQGPVPRVLTLEQMREVMALRDLANRFLG